MCACSVRACVSLPAMLQLPFVSAVSQLLSALPGLINCTVYQLFDRRARRAGDA